MGPGHFDHVVSIEIGALSALHPSGLSKLEARAELQEEPEKMEMGEPSSTGKEEERESLKTSRAELEEVTVGSKPPTPPLHRFPSWVRSDLRMGPCWAGSRAKDRQSVH
jgi:hypothetical protein